jgi:hypothetical protein
MGNKEKEKGETEKGGKTIKITGMENIKPAKIEKAKYKNNSKPPKRLAETKLGLAQIPAVAQKGCAVLAINGSENPIYCL